MKRIEVLNESYTNLDYNNNDKQKALNEINDLAKTVRFHRSIDLSKRLNKLIDIIQENVSLFKSVYRHVDVIDTILEYLSNFANDFQNENALPQKFPITLFVGYLTLFQMCKDSAMQSFLIYPTFTDYLWDVEEMYSEMKKWIKTIPLVVEMVILEDSDLYAVINYLIITNDFPLSKIWVQKRIKEKFLWLLHKYSDSFNIKYMYIYTFQSVKDIQICAVDTYAIPVVSIWSEDIVAAKNLALSLKNVYLIFINSHMDFSSGTVVFPYRLVMIRGIGTLNIFRNTKDLTNTEQSVNVVHFSDIAKINYTSIYNFFYDDTWQEPVNGTYWKHNNNLWANATNVDILKCYESAVKGFRTWSTKSIQTRIQILSNLVPILEHKNKHVLATIVTRWLNFPYLFPTVQGRFSPNGNIEIIEHRKALNIIILREENENVLFFRLMQSLIAGNSVIIIFDANFCNFTPYCDMFSLCKIPPGVINLLSHEDTNILSSKLCSKNYIDYANEIFVKGHTLKAYIESYKNITVIQFIIIHFK